MANGKKSGIIVMVLAVAAIVLFVSIMQMNKTKVAELNQKLMDKDIRITNLNKELEIKSEEVKALKEHVDSLKDKDDLLKADIQSYIKTTHPKVPTVVAHEIAINVVDYGRKYNVSPELIVGIIKVESAFNPMAVGPKTKYGHARGLMQVMPEWAKKFELKNEYELHEIHIAIESGIKVFKIHLEEGKGDISTGLYYYVNHDKAYVGNVYAAMGKFVAYRSTINNNDHLNVETDIDRNGDSKQLPVDPKTEPEAPL
jgi:hypothetical protein